jgi:hypothetical protein
VRRVAGMLQDAGDHAATASLYRRVVKNAEKALLKDSRRPKPRFSIYFRKSLKSSVRLMKRSLKDLEPEAHKEKLM